MILWTQSCQLRVERSRHCGIMLNIILWHLSFPGSIFHAWFRVDIRWGPLKFISSPSGYNSGFLVQSHPLMNLSLNIGCFFMQRAAVSTVWHRGAYRWVDGSNRCQISGRRRSSSAQSDEWRCTSSGVSALFFHEPSLTPLRLERSVNRFVKKTLMSESGSFRGLPALRQSIAPIA
jgi:hypothetical protein